MNIDQRQCQELQKGALNHLADHQNRQAQGAALGYQAKPINEPTTLGRATELLNHVATLEMHTASLNSALFGIGLGPSCEHPEPSTLDGMLAAACERVACLCGNFATLKRRLGCTPE